MYVFRFALWCSFDHGRGQICSHPLAFFNPLQFVTLSPFLKPLQFHPPPIKHRVCEIINPIPYDGLYTIVISNIFVEILTVQAKPQHLVQATNNRWPFREK